MWISSTVDSTAEGESTDKPRVQSWVTDSGLKQLDVLGIVTLEEGGPSGTIQPVVPFDRIEIHIDYPLLDRGDADTAASP